MEVAAPPEAPHHLLSLSGGKIRGWRRLPTAWIHFLLGENFHVYLATLTWHRLIVGINSEIALVCVDLQPVDRYYSNLFFFGYASGLNLTLNEGKPLELPEAWATGVDVPWEILAWALPAGAALLWLSGVFILASARIWSFEQGSYLNFTWQFQRSLIYRLCFLIMAAGPVLLPIVWMLQVYLYTDGDDMATNLEVMKKNTVHGLLLLKSLSHLAYQTKPMHQWQESSTFMRIRFRRSWLSMLLGSNASFGVKLVDALYRAEFGDISRLRRYVPGEGRAEALLTVLQGATQAEAAEKARGRAQSQKNSRPSAGSAAAGSGAAEVGVGAEGLDAEVEAKAAKHPGAGNGPGGGLLDAPQAASRSAAGPKQGGDARDADVGALTPAGVIFTVENAGASVGIVAKE